MKFINEYQNKLGLRNNNEVFDFIINNLTESNRTYDYYVNWKKVFKNVGKIEIELNILNSLIGKRDVENECKKLLASYPEVIKVFPYLLAIRDTKITVLNQYSHKGFDYKYFDFNNKKATRLSSQEIDDLVSFLKGSKLLDLFSQKKIKSLVDYTTGVEVGLDSNGRKNRSGTTMEGIVEYFICHMCSTHSNWRYLTQVNSTKLLAEWKVKLPFKDSQKTIDFVIDNGISIFLIEANYYGGGGSKLKSTAGEYQKMFKYYNENGFKFLWITDGPGWKEARMPLKDSFNDLDFILNLEMLSNGILNDIISNNY